jgi:putative ABC transport system ATP-binding protein
VVFQSFNLITKYTALENVVLSMDVAGYKTKNKKQRALELLQSVELDEDEADRRVLKLSGGQQQRVAIARALSYDPDIILADEPTGNLDTETQNEIMAIFRGLADQGKCVIIVSHSPQVAAMCDACYELVKLGRSK